MPLFEVDARRSTLVQPLAPADAGFVEQAGPVVDDHVSRLLGEQLFTVASREPGTRPEDAPHLLALDASGQPVVIEMVSRLDAAALALALAHAGRAARLSRADVADRFPDGAREFERSFAAFQDGTPIARTRGQREGSRLLLLCAQVDPSVADALEFLRLTSTAVSVLRLGVVTGPDGRRLVEVEPLYSAAARRGRTNGATSNGPTPDAAPTRAAYRAPTASPSVESPAATAPTRAVPPPRATPVPSATGAPATDAPAPGAPTTTAPAAPVDPAAAPARTAAPSVPAAPAVPSPAASTVPPPSRAARTRASRSAATPASAAVPADAPAPVTAPTTAASAPTTRTPDAPRSASSAARTGASGVGTRSASPSPTFVPRTDAHTSTPLPMRSRAARRRDADVVSNVFARPEPDDHTTSGLNTSTFRGRAESPAPDLLAGAPSSSDPLPDLHGSALPPVDLPPLPPVDLPALPPLDLPGLPPVDLPVDGEEDPDLSMLAAHLGRSTTLVWARPRRGQSFRAQLLPTGEIELPGVGLFRNPDAAASAAIGHDREDGWDVWRVGDNGPSLTEVFREQFA